MAILAGYLTHSVLVESTDSAGSVDSNAKLTGTITYRERTLLPPDAEISVTLADVSLPDVAARQIARVSFPAAGASPYPFELPYNPDAIVERNRYGLRVRIERAGQLLFINDTPIDPFAAAPGTAIDVVVKRTGGGGPNVRNPAEMPDANLTENYGKALRVDGTTTSVFEGQREIHLVLQADGLARGNSGCNPFRGGYEASGNTLEFGGLASTRMACRQGMAQEQQFLRALGATTEFRITGDTLTLTDATGAARVYFEAIYLR